MNLKCAIFDFDGTLFDSMLIWETAGQRFLRGQGREPKPNVREDVRTLSLYQSACYFRREYDLSLSPEEIMEEINRVVEHFYLQEAQPKPGVIRFLERLKQAGVHMCIATASERYQIEAALKRCDMEGFFDSIFTCTEVGHGKDEPFIFRRAMESFRADRGSTVIFEDALHAVRTAKADSFHVAAVYDASEKRQDELKKLCDCYLTDFEHPEPFWKYASAQ